jgi:hypothetical protein
MIRHKARVIAIAAILVVGCGVAAFAATGDAPSASSDRPDVRYAPTDADSLGVTFQDTGSGEADLRAEWKAEVAAGALRDDVSNQRFDDPEPGALRASLRAVAERDGYTVISVSTISGRQIAPIVELTTTDPAVAVQDMQSLSNDLFGVPSRYEASYLTVSDTSGAPVYTLAASFRTGIGQTQIRSSLDTRSGMAAPR